MEGAISPRLFEAVDGRVHGLSGGGERASGQYFDLLGVSDCVSSVDDFLTSGLQFLGEVSELGHFAFDKGISESLYGVIDDGLVVVPRLEYALSKGVERGLRTVARSSSQFDSEDWVTFTHSEMGARTRIVEYKSYEFGLSLVVVGVVDGRRDAESSV